MNIQLYCPALHSKTFIITLNNKKHDKCLTLLVCVYATVIAVSLKYYCIFFYIIWIFV